MATTPIAWDELLYESLVGSSSTWSNALIHDELLNALQRIAAAPIQPTPFPHVRVNGLFSDRFYAALMAELPHHSAYTRQEYAGTNPNPPVYCVRKNDVAHSVRVPDDCKGSESGPSACYSKTVNVHSENARKGSTLFVQQTPRLYPLWLQAFRLVHSTNFTQLLVDKFSLDGEQGVPRWKRKHAHGYPLKNTAALRVEPTQYHLTPHIDVKEKIVTWQFFHPKSSELSGRGMGTFFYKPKAGLRLQVDDRKNPRWMAYDNFDAVLEHPVVPNSFFAFAPNNRSWHGANITAEQWEGVADRTSRRTFLGFVTSLRDEWHHFNKNDWVDRSFGI